MKKRIFALLFCFVIMPLTLCSCQFSWKHEQSGIYTYSKYKTGFRVSVTMKEKDNGILELPKYFRGKPILKIAGISGYLEEIVIPKTITEIGVGVISSKPDLVTIIVDENNKTFDSRNSCNAIIETETNKLVTGCKTTIIPDNVTSIGESAFRNCSGLTSIAVPYSVTSIGDNAFYGCEGLKSIVIPTTVTSFGYLAFDNCGRDLKIFYKGTSEPDNLIYTNWNCGHKVYYYRITAPTTSGNYWHYVNETPTIW